MRYFILRKQRSKRFKRPFKISRFKIFREIKEARESIKNKDFMREKKLMYLKKNQMEIPEIKIVTEIKKIIITDKLNNRLLKDQMR